jgi:CRP-like cAMP-binding protein
MSDASENDLTPIVRVDLRRADLVSLCHDDPVLARCGLCAALGVRRDATLKNGIARRYPDKVVVFSRGDLSGSLFLVLNGEVRLFGKKGNDVVELPPARKGDVAGEGEVLAGDGLRRVTAIAHGSAELGEFSRELLLDQGQLQPALSTYLEQVRQGRTAALDEMANFLNRW